MNRLKEVWSALKPLGIPMLVALMAISILVVWAVIIIVRGMRAVPSCTRACEPLYGEVVLQGAGVLSPIKCQCSKLVDPVHEVRHD